MATHDHPHRGQSLPSQGSFWTSRAFLVCSALLVVAGFLLWTEHLAHALGVLPYLLIAACPLMHFLMHGRHGGHGRHAHHRPAGSDGASAKRDQP